MDTLSWYLYGVSERGSTYLYLRAGLQYRTLSSNNNMYIITNTLSRRSFISYLIIIKKYLINKEILKRYSEVVIINYLYYNDIIIITRYRGKKNILLIWTKKVIFSRLFSIVIIISKHLFRRLFYRLFNYLFNYLFNCLFNIIIIFIIFRSKR